MKSASCWWQSCCLGAVLLLSSWWIGAADARPREDATEYVLVFLDQGDVTLSAGEQQAARKGHFENIGRMHREGTLLLAGPFAEPRPTAEREGLFLFDLRTVEQARELAATDPAVQAGLLTIESRPFSSSSTLRRLPELERALKTHRAAYGPLPAGRFDVRPYVLVTSEKLDQAEAALAPLRENGFVPISGRIGGEDGESALFMVAADSPEAVLELLRDSGAEPLDGAFHTWWSTASLERLPFHSRYPAAPTFDLKGIAEDGPLAAFRPAFSKAVEVFGVRVVATADVIDRKVLHAAHVLAQYLDNDENGEPDDPLVCQALRQHGAFLAMAANDREFDQIELDFEALSAAGFELGQDLYAEETLPDGPPHVDASGRFDATLEEVWHLVSHGWAIAYPEVFGFDPGTTLTDAMDVARGGRHFSLPERYPPAAWYHYDDRTCEYVCMAAEYSYWVLTSLLGGQGFPGRAAEISGEWELPTPDLVRGRDRAATALFAGSEFRLPRRLPDGGYRR